MRAFARGVSWFAVLLGLILVPDLKAAKVDFNRDIRPVMADTCFNCHGFDEKARKAGLRLDVRADALKPTKSGAIPIVPGQPQQSELIRRLFTQDADDQMPPAKFNKPLSPAQKDLFRRWIAEGAEYRDHWAFLPPANLPPPKVKQVTWPKTSVDHFILARLEQEKLKPSREADKRTLIRRVSLDLTGLPPTLGEVNAFLADHSRGAYEKVVDRLLASPRYGERMAQDWLDAARFADSNGYQVDRDREMGAWREWVIKAFNRNLPFDQFTVEQLAGDLLPQPTLDQRIATGFHRNHMINEEGGIIPEEFLTEYCADRVETTSTVWLGLTLGCARCHDHKYDPFTQKDYYSLFAFFHNVTEKGVGDYGQPIRRNTPPFLKLPAPEAEAKLAPLRQELDAKRVALTNLTTAALADQAEWEQRAKAAVPEWAETEVIQANAGTNALAPAQTEGWVRVAQRPGTNLTMTIRVPRTRVTAVQVDFALAPDSGTKRTGEVAVAKLRLFQVGASEPEKRPVMLRATTRSGAVATDEVAKALEGKTNDAWRIKLAAKRTKSGIFELTEPAQGSNEVVLKLELDLALTDKTELPAWQFRLRATDLAPDLLVPPEVMLVLTRPAAERSSADQQQLKDFRLARYPGYPALAKEVEELKKKYDEIDLSIPITLVMEEMAEPRPTFVLQRGAYDRPGERVVATTPARLPAFPSGGPTNRLGLARWLVDPANPLTARVTVNRLWQTVFGTGLVRTAEDFGTRGEAPSHPELLDWLAIEFVRTGWDVKRMMKLLVVSAAYRQDSRMMPELRARDPDNRLLARGPRYRLPAEMIRDQALAVSGLLVEKLGGPSVKPYHPPGLYEQVVSGSSASTYVQDKGDALYRRSLYTYWKRSVPNPAMLIFDAPFRETCTVRRSRTSTPLQALDLLNDPTYVEASRLLAQRMMCEGGSKPEQRIRLGFRLATGRDPRSEELQVLVSGLRRMETSFRSDRSSAESLLAVGETKAGAAIDAVELAAYSTVASTLLNLDETITKE